MLNPELWPWGLAGLLTLIALKIVVAIALYRRGWNTMMVLVNTALNVVFFSWTLTLLIRGELFSAEFINLWSDSGVNTDSLHTLAVIFGFGVAGICLWEIIDGWVKTYRANQTKRTPNNVLTP